MDLSPRCGQIAKRFHLQAEEGQQMGSGWKTGHNLCSNRVFPHHCAKNKRGGMARK